MFSLCSSEFFFGLFLTWKNYTIFRIALCSDNFFFCSWLSLFSKRHFLCSTCKTNMSTNLGLFTAPWMVLTLMALESGVLLIGFQISWHPLLTEPVQLKNLCAFVCDENGIVIMGSFERYDAFCREFCSRIRNSRNYDQKTIPEKKCCTF